MKESRVHYECDASMGVGDDFNLVGVPGALLTLYDAV